MRRSGITAFVTGVALLASISGANAQFFDYSVVFENSGGTPVTTVTSSDSLSTIAVTNDGTSTGIFAGNTGTDAEMVNFTTTSSSVVTDGSQGNFSFPYRLAYTIQPSNINGVVTPGTVPLTGIFLGTISGNMTQNVNNLTNAYNGIVTTSFGPAEVQIYSFPSISEEFDALALVADFSPGSPPGVSSGSGGMGSHVLGSIALAGAPEPGNVALLFGMSAPVCLMARRRFRRNAVVTKA